MSSPAKRKAPAFQFYADDFIAGTLDMSQSDVGSYIRLLCHQWSRGSIPVQPEKQQRLAGGSFSDDVLKKFKIEVEGGLANERMEAERLKQSEYRQKQSKKGKASAEARKNRQNTNHGSTEPQPSYQPEAQPNAQPEAQPEGNSPSPSPSPNNRSSQWTVGLGVELPEALRTIECLAAVKLWLKHKKEKGQSYKVTGLTAALKKWETEYGPSELPKAIERAMANNWAGVHPDNDKKVPPPPITPGQEWRNDPTDWRHSL
jgi:uncharacterized protein YdaU (DUF1376 family)